jgi:archaeal flagellin FlaB
MGKIRQILKNSDIADMGIGAMIVFIAMVLVAGIAASVLVQTANKLEIQAMTTGDETINEVSTGLHVADITGHKTGAVIDYAYITVQPRAGTSDIDLAKTYIEVSNSAKKCVLTYSQAAFHLKEDIDGNMFTATFYNPALTSTTFGVIVLEDADNSLTAAAPVLNLGDKVALTLYPSAANAFGGFAVRTDIWGMVQPEEGSSGVFAFTTPASYAAATVFDLY